MNAYLAAAWIAGLITLALIVLMVVLHRQTRGAFAAKDVGNLPAAPDWATPYIAAATLIALGVAFYSASQTGAAPVAVTLAHSGCTTDPVLHASRVAAAGAVATLSLSGAAACAQNDVALYLDGAAPLAPLRLGDTIIWFTPALNAGSHIYVLAVTPHASSAGAASLTGSIDARAPLSLADFGTSGIALFGTLSAFAGLLAAVFAIFKRA